MLERPLYSRSVLLRWPLCCCLFDFHFDFEAFAWCDDTATQNFEGGSCTRRLILLLFLLWFRRHLQQSERDGWRAHSAFYLSGFHFGRVNHNRRTDNEGWALREGMHHAKQSVFLILILIHVHAVVIPRCLSIISAAIPSPGAWVRAADQETRNYHPNKAKTSRPIYGQTIAIICNSRCSRAFSEIERVNSARKVNKNLMLNAYRFHHHHLHLHLRFHQKSKPNSPNSSGNSIHLFLVEKKASKEKAMGLRWGDGDLIADSRMTLHTRQKSVRQL